MKAKNLYVLLAKDASRDADGGLLTLFKIIDKLSAELDVEKISNKDFKKNKTAVVIPTSYVIATSWYLGKEQEPNVVLRLEIDYIEPNGTTLKGPRQEYTLDKSAEKLNMNINANGMPATKSGDYILRARLYGVEDKLIDEEEFPFHIDLIWK